MTASPETADFIVALCFILGYMVAAIAVLCLIAIAVMLAWRGVLELKLLAKARKPLPPPTVLAYRNDASLEAYRVSERDWKRLREVA